MTNITVDTFLSLLPEALHGQYFTIVEHCVGCREGKSHLGICIDQGARGSDKLLSLHSPLCLLRVHVLGLKRLVRLTGCRPVTNN